MVVITGAACDVTGGSKYLVSRNMLSSLLVVQVENHWVQRFAPQLGGEVSWGFWSPFILFLRPRVFFFYHNYSLGCLSTVGIGGSRRQIEFMFTIESIHELF